MTNWRDEKQRVVAALEQVLPALAHPHLAVPLGFRVSQATGLDEKRCRTILGWLANEGHPNATHDGGEVRSYGRVVTRWRWHPTPQRAEAAVDATRRLQQFADTGVYEPAQGDIASMSDAEFDKALEVEVNRDPNSARSDALVDEQIRRERLAQGVHSAIDDSDW